MKAINIHNRTTFIKPAVKEISLTREIINSIIPYFPTDCKCIAGYLDNGDQFWKVNYHWDVLNLKISEFLEMGGISPELKHCAQAIKNVLLSNSPNPITGYRTDTFVGMTKDISSPDKIIARHAILKQCKKDFERVIIRAKIVNEATKRNPLRKEKSWWLAVAPVALPGNSKHGTGYALDISGNNEETTRICRGLGATLIFNEASHVHVEFGRGVRFPMIL